MKKIIIVCIIMFIQIVGHAQFSKQTNDQFLKFMVAYADNYSSISFGSYDSLFETYAMRGYIPDVVLVLKRKNNTTDKYITGIIGLPEDYSTEQYLQKFDEWAKNISQLKLNGAGLVEEKDNRYEKGKNDMYIKGKKWKFDNSSGNIAKEYKSFSIRLELLDLMQGGWMLEFIIGNENLKN